MQMRMPDRLQYAMNVDPSALKVRCPPTTLLTLVENAVRHGIDPCEEGGRIDIDIHMRGAHYGEIAKSTGGFFFVWTLWALGALGGFTFIFSARGLWSLRRGQPR